jgi:uncharacterized protein YecE (DUF72 family)
MDKQKCIGTSGFSYTAWKDVFYPPGMRSADWLTYYSTRFNSLELNSTFYHFPRIATLEKMAARTPDDFVFTVKMNKHITHTLRLKNAREKVQEFISVAEAGFGDKLGCILYQLPPSFKYSEENLQYLLESIPRGSRNVVEFRHVSWWNEELPQVLTEHELTFCNISYPGLPEDRLQTSDRYYIRMHGVPDLFKSAYSPEELQKLAEELPADADQTYVYFNNTMFEAGFSNALSLQELLSTQNAQP